MTKISVCMITWNEQDTIREAIESTVGLADEIVIFDTGSTDQTVKICRALGTLVHTGGDRMHKGAARNTAMRLAHGDWIVILDADERIADPAGVRKFIEKTTSDALFVNIAFMKGDEITLSYAQQRIWRKGTYRYQYRAHECPIPINDWGKQEYTAFIWEHRPPAGRKWKSQYTLDRLILDVEENPDAPRPLYYLGRQHVYRREWAKARRVLDRYLASPGRDEADAWHNLAQCYHATGEEKRRVKALYQACACTPSRREFWGVLATIYHERGQNEIATGLLKCALEQPPPSRNYVRHYWHGAAIYDLLARCLWKLGKHKEGLPYAQRAAELAPEDVRIQKNLWWFESALGDMDAFYSLHGANAHGGQPRHAAIAALCMGPRVLDVGCGTGDLLLLLEQAHPDWTCEGTDISKVALGMARERGIKGELHLSSSILGDNWTSIVVSQVLEHVEDDDAFVAECISRIPIGGTLIVSVPKDNLVPAHDHKREYSERSLLALLSKFGDARLHEWPDKYRLLATVRR